MTNKEFLRQGFDLHVKIEKIQRRIDVLNSHLQGSSPTIKIGSSGTRVIGSAFEDMMVEIVDLKNQKEELEKQYAAIKQTIATIISAIGDETCEALLRDRYLLFLSWKDIALELGYQMSYTYELHGRALQLIKIPS